MNLLKKLNQKEQKLVYLAHGANLAVNEEPLIKDAIEAWYYGTVIRCLHAALNKYGNLPINHLIRWGEDMPFYEDEGGDKIALEELKQPEEEIINEVFKKFSRYEAFQLSAITHAKEGPWDKHCSKKNGVIPDEEIKNYFNQLFQI